AVDRSAQRDVHDANVVHASSALHAESRLVDVILTLRRAVLLPQSSHLTGKQLLLQRLREERGEQGRHAGQTQCLGERRYRLRLVVYPVDPVKLGNVLDLSRFGVLQVADDEELAGISRYGNDGAEAIELVAVIDAVLRVEGQRPAQLPLLAVF